MIRGGGRPERFVILGNGRVPTKIPLPLREDGGNVGISTADPRTQLDVVGTGSASGDLTVGGNLSVAGTKSSVATLSDGRRVLLYAIERPKDCFEDFGTSQQLPRVPAPERRLWRILRRGAASLRR